jgi:hypothetical protein
MLYHTDVGHHWYGITGSQLVPIELQSPMQSLQAFFSCLTSIGMVAVKGHEKHHAPCFISGSRLRASNDSLYEE